MNLSVEEILEKLPYLKPALYKRLLQEGKHHYGIIVSPQIPIGETLRRIQNLLINVSSDQMHNRLEFLSNVK